MSAHCRFADCEEKPGLFGAAGRCRSCGETYCGRHLAEGDYARFLRESLPDVHPGGRGFCIDCVLRHRPEHVKGAVDKKCSRVDCLAGLSSMSTVKRLCSYCGRWFCSSHFLTREDLTTELLSSMKKHRQTGGEGACEECLRKDPVGALVVSNRGTLQRMGTALSDAITARVQAALPEIAQKTGASLARGAVGGLKEGQQVVAEVAGKALDQPVKQRLWATLIGLAGAQIAVLASMAYASRAAAQGFYQTYRWVFFAIVVFLFLVTCITISVRLHRIWRRLGQAGEVGDVAKEAVRSSLVKALMMNLPVLVLVLALTIAAGVLFALQR